ncbi:calcium-binding protein [Inquilinus sp. Marseille-Q2685]|uniref:calcium-binding protein n=1 Tax=Inquilinus sp. Marseille-Q2685 TaxID=2866581 RepID=UPI001CE455F6|nr:calcium-binding protein [Inquilinus sp. Marseille-Q2685]
MANRIDGTLDDDILHGTDQADEIHGYAGDDTLQGKAHDDRLIGGAGADTLDGGAGFDTVSYADSIKAVTVNLASGRGTAGTAFGDRLISIEAVEGSAYADILLGSTAADTLRGGAGADTLDGGEGFDTVSYADSIKGVTVNLASGRGTAGTAFGDRLISIEAVRGSAYADILLGSAADNVLDGDDGDDVLEGYGGGDTLGGGRGNDILIAGSGGDLLAGGDGNDTLVDFDSSGGNDSLIGDDGFDTVSYANSTEGVTVDLTTGHGRGGAAHWDSLLDIEAVEGSAYSDALIGKSDANTLRGNDGNDVLRGEAGADILDGGGGFDTVGYTESNAGVTVNLATGIVSGGDATGDTLVSIEGINGSAYADTLIGNSGDNVLQGSAGADTLDGGNGVDTASYADSTKGVTVNLATGIASGGTATGDTLVSIEGVNGSAYDDTLIGSAAADILAGGWRKDVLTGGGGADRFVFTDARDSSWDRTYTDRITDFSRAQGDKIDLSTIDANGDGAGNGSFTFIGTAAYTGVAGQLRYAVSGTDVVIGGDIDGDGVFSDFNIVLSHVGSLQEADFVL